MCIGWIIFQLVSYAFVTVVVYWVGLDGCDGSVADGCCGGSVACYVICGAGGGGCGKSLWVIGTGMDRVVTNNPSSITPHLK